MTNQTHDLREQRKEVVEKIWGDNPFPLYPESDDDVERIIAHTQAAVREALERVRRKLRRDSTPDVSLKASDMNEQVWRVIDKELAHLKEANPKEKHE
jgi:hypothetical protein